MDVCVVEYRALFNMDEIDRAIEMTPNRFQGCR
jgi:hypothetical protein